MRRIALAEELIGDPAFLLLDELTSGLDPFSDREMMHWLHELSHEQGKTIVLVTHSTNHLEYCDAIVFLHKGHLVHAGPLPDLLQSHQVESISDLYAIYQTQEVSFPEPEPPPDVEVPVHALKTARPPSGWGQFPTLLARQTQLFLREKSQIILHVILIFTFPCLVAVFASKGLPQVRSLDMNLDSNIIHTLVDQLQYLQESFKAAALISGLAMFQVVLLTLIGANNGAREIAKETNVLSKELRAGLSPFSYVVTKFLQVVFLSLLQAFWMAWFVKTMCSFPGSLLAQFGILFMATLAMSTTCLAISAYAPSPERASLLAIYLVGFQLPLSGAALALPDWLSSICRPFIVAYWGWSGYLKTLENFRIYDIVKQSTRTTISEYWVCLTALSLHVVIALLLACYYVRKRNGRV